MSRLLIATRKGLFILTRGAGGTWQIGEPAFYGDNCTMVVHDPRDGAIYAALNHGHFGCKMHRSDNGGRAWTEIAVPVYPEAPAGHQEPQNMMGGKPVPWKLIQIWELTPGGRDEPGVIWCGTLPGGLFRSSDRGASWEMVRSLWDHPLRQQWAGGGYDTPGIHSVLVDPRNSRRITIGVSVGGVWQSGDGGATWRLTSKGMRAEYMPPERAYEEIVQDPHIVASCLANPDAMWVQHHNGIFRSMDGAATWTECTRPAVSGFGFAVAVHPRDPKTAWFVPAIKDEKRIPSGGRLVVTKTRDGGESFETLGNGLPVAHAYDLVFRHALAVDDQGSEVVFGSTTGNAYASADGGARWSRLDASLPPIYAIRFA